MNKPFKSVEELRGHFIDITGRRPRENNLWPPVIVTKEDLDAEIERLAALPAPEDGRRESLIVHPHARAETPGLACSSSAWNTCRPFS